VFSCILQVLEEKHSKSIKFFFLISTQNLSSSKLRTKSYKEAEEEAIERHTLAIERTCNRAPQPRDRSPLFAAEQGSRQTCFEKILNQLQLDFGLVGYTKSFRVVPKLYKYYPKSSKTGTQALKEELTARSRMVLVLFSFFLPLFSIYIYIYIYF
jgi:hypothetical protein